MILPFAALAILFFCQLLHYFFLNDDTAPTIEKERKNIELINT